MTAYTEFFLNCPANVAQLECLEISHSAFSQTYYVVRNAVGGVTVTHEDSTVRAYQYYPLECKLSGPRDDLDHTLSVNLGDLGEIVPDEMDNVREAEAFDELPIVLYRTYRSNDLDEPLYGPIELEIKNFNFDRTGCTFDARAPSLNVNRTGEIYSLPRFPMLRGLM
jgi:hypothetical protein